MSTEPANTRGLIGSWRLRMLLQLLRSLQRTCEGKLRFSQHRRAAARAGRNQYAYECQVCGGWHLATDPLRRLVDRLAMVRRDRRGAA